MKIVFKINGMEAYKVGTQWVTFCDGRTIVFERLSQFVCWATNETYKALMGTRKRQAVYITGLN